MEKRKIELKAMLPTLTLVLFILLMMGLAFLPTVRGGTARTVETGFAASGDGTDILYKCEEYALEHGFGTTLSGNVKASVFGIPYTLEVGGGRNVSGDSFTDIKESVSAMAKVGVKTCCANGDYRVAQGEYDKKTKTFSYGDGESLSGDEFVRRYGMPPTKLVKYALDGNIASVECIDENTFKYVLDVRAVELAKNEVQTILNSKKPPEYKSVELTLITDGTRAIKITAVEKFRADKFGGINCTATYTEVFSYDKY